ncbi:MAG: hypothetical protein M1829_006797 [Trizodia sp. TS-e1964]|nr:MAG: hypothetical protein M1829_006797 [Trizodia sp. TS-e1964]
MDQPATHTRPSLQATWITPNPPQASSPQTTRVFEMPLPSTPAEPSTSEKTAFLAALRCACLELQEQVNQCLTLRMEEEKGGVGEGMDAMGEGREEENYGEESAGEE